MKYDVVKLQEKKIVGLCARTGNSSPDCAQIIGGLWERFMGEKVFESVKNIANPSPIGLYSDYDAASYDVTIGVEVTKNEEENLVEKIIPAGSYARFSIKGDVVKDVSNAWNEIWKMDLNRSFKADFEEYLSNVNGTAEINIYISLND